MRRYCPIPLTVSASSVRPKAERRLLRLSLIAAAVTLLISATAFTAAKIGWFHTWNTEELWARQARETAPVQTTPLPKPVYYDVIAEALDPIDAPAHMIPLWMPAGYKMIASESTTTASTSSYAFSFGNANLQWIILQLSSYSNSNAYSYSIDEGSPDVYTAGGIDHSILTNMDSYGAVWYRENYECFIYGYENRNDLIKTIDSFYMEVKNE